MEIRPATAADGPAIWAILKPVIRAGETFALDRAMSEDAALRFWTGPGMEAFVAEEDGVVIGTYYLRANLAGGGGHVCNCGYMVASAARGQGVAGRLCNHSLQTARELSFQAMQFNSVVASNTVAVTLWQKHGFQIIGTLPRAYRHRTLGLVDCYIMHREL